MAYNVQLKKSDGSLYEDVYVATRWSLISDKPSTFTPTSHNHDDIYYTETEINTKLNDKVDKADRYEMWISTSTDAKAIMKYNATTESIEFIFN